MPNSHTEAPGPHPDPLVPGPQPALTHQTPGGGRGSRGTPTCPSHPPGRCLGRSWLFEPGPGAGAGMRLGITPKMHVSSFCPIVQPGAATMPSPRPSHQLSWPLCEPAPLPPPLSSWGLLLRPQGTRKGLAGSQNARGLLTSL